MNRLKHLENRIRGWLPKEPDLKSFKKIAHSSMPEQQPFRVEWQAEESLLYTIRNETGTHSRLSYYFALASFPLLSLLLVYLWFLLPYSLVGKLGELSASMMWQVFFYLSILYQGIQQAGLKLKLDQELKKGLVNGAVCLLKYYDKIYTSRRNFSLFDSALCFGLFGYLLVASLLGDPMFNFAKYFVFVIPLFGLVLGFGVVLAFVPFWYKRTRDSKKARVQNLLNQIKPPYEV